MDELPRHPHAQTGAQLFSALDCQPGGLSMQQARLRLDVYGLNRLPEAEPLSPLTILIHQFASPLIYILLLAAVVSLLLGDWADAAFIFAALLINAIIGGLQEYSAQRSARTLDALVTLQAEVLRDDEIVELDASQLVPGDIVLIESGKKVPADLRLLECHNLSLDESLLTGESLPSEKRCADNLPQDTTLGERRNMAFAGSIVATGRGRALVTGVGSQTELGKIARSVLQQEAAKPPLMLRMERFTRRITLTIAAFACLLVVVSVWRGLPLSDTFVLVVALSVSAIPEGLPVAITVALAVAMARMARRNVIVRRLVAIEALGSCTCIASDKTGTLTVNQLTVRQIVLPDGAPVSIGGEGIVPEGNLTGADLEAQRPRLVRLARAAILANQGLLTRRDREWAGHGDSVDIALLAMAHKLGVSQPDCLSEASEIDLIPYESEHRYAAALHRRDDTLLVTVKGAIETVLEMCDSMESAAGPVLLDADLVRIQAHALSESGYRVLALAQGRPTQPFHELGESPLQGLTLLGLVGMSDPPRPEAAAAIAACHRSGIHVVMVTGDHPATALAVAKDLGLAEHDGQVVTGHELKEAFLDSQTSFDALCRDAHVFARVEPRQKLEIVEALQRNGHFVAVTGDGVNDAPALRAAHVGVAMGKSGTDVARETAGLILTDDNFASIVAGIEEGRIAYNNIRKVIFLLISTAAGELVLFLLALLTGTPFPLFAAQLLWLNLVTNGIQDVALAFEPAEGHELARPPRAPGESIFDRLMIERVALSAVLMGGIGFALYQVLLGQGMGQIEASNVILLLMVLFENIQAFNSRSESLSVFRHELTRNRLLLFGTLAAQLVHIIAMYTPGLSHVLRIQPVTLPVWLGLLALSLTLLAALEAHKRYRRRHPFA